MALIHSKDVITEVMNDFSKTFGRPYKPVETYNTDNADFVYIALGSIGENIKTAILEMKEQGKEAGLVSLRLFRPFPGDELFSVLKDKKRIAVVERAMPGGAANGPLFQEVATLMYTSGIDVKIENYILGLGGRDVLPETFIDIYNGVAHTKDTVPVKEKNYDVIGVRG
jgi:pyruvate ferredoxin oxidoreductase alpha subunit